MVASVLHTFMHAPAGIYCGCTRIFTVDVPGYIIWMHRDVDVFSRCMHPMVYAVDVPAGIYCGCTRVFTLDVPGYTIWMYPDVDVFSRIYTPDVSAGVYRGCTRGYTL